MQLKTGFACATLFGLLLYLALQAWGATSMLGAAAKNKSIFTDSTLQQSAVLELNAQEMRDRLEYMVFEKERKEALVQLSESLQQQINLQPWTPQKWRQLLFSTTELATSQQERDWVFSVAVSLQKWDRNARLRLSNRCVRFKQEPSQKWNQLCHELLSNLAYENNPKRLLRIIQVSKQELDEALQYYKVKPAELPTFMPNWLDANDEKRTGDVKK